MRRYSFVFLLTGYFIDFMSKNLQRVKQGEDKFDEDRERVKFLFWAKDYIEDKTAEKYRISISKDQLFTKQA